MKLHPHLIKAVEASLDVIFNKRHYADQVIEKTTKSHPKWGSRDRRFFAEAVYDLVRWIRRYHYLANINGNTNTNNTNGDTGIASASHAGDDVEMPQQWSALAIEKIVAFYLAEKYPTDKYPSKDSDENPLPIGNPAKAPTVTEALQLVAPAVRHSYPDWLYEYGEEQLGESNWAALCERLNTKAPVFLRTNTLKITRDELVRKLEAEQVECEWIENSDVGLRLTVRKNIQRTQAFQAGLFEIQDGGSQLIAPFVDPRPGETIVDACAGGGGKSLHLAALMQNSGRILSMDIVAQKIERLRARANRAGVKIIETRWNSGAETITAFRGQVDRLLLDVPCSGLGVLRRKVDTKWKIQKKDIEQLVKTQSEIIDSYSAMVKPGGTVVYATCSILPEENERQVRDFLKDQKNWELESELHIDPRHSDFDGFYMARLINTNPPSRRESD